MGAFQLHRRISVLRRPFGQCDRASTTLDATKRERDSLEIEKAALLTELEALKRIDASTHRRIGFSQIDVSFESPDHPHGPCFAVAAKR